MTMLRTESTIAGRYRIEERLGAGGTAVVYRAFDTQLGRRVTLKLLHEHAIRDPELLERFDREARAIARLGGHPNVVTVLDCGEHDGRRFIVFEYVDGGDLRALIAAEGALPVDRAVKLGGEIASALAHAHAHGIVHRDVKSANVLLADGTAKVADFSIASTALSGLTESGTVLGSAEYLSPEQATGSRADERSDVYAVGVVLYELLAGRVPFDGASFFETARRHVEETPPDLRQVRPDVPPRLARVVARALEKAPERRFASMAELGAALRGSVSPEPDGDATLVIRRRREAPARHAGRRWAVAAGAAAALALAGALALLSIHGISVPHLSPPAADATGTPLTAVAAYDPPPGDGVEDDAALARATDGDPATLWATEWYATDRFGGLKPGVGIVAAASAPVELSSLTVRSDTPGYTAVVEAGDSEHGPFARVSSPQTAGPTATFSLHLASPARYYLLWITGLPPETTPRYHVDVGEIRGAR